MFFFFFFLTNHDGLDNLGRGSPKKHFCQINYINIQQVVSHKKIFKYIGKISPNPLTAMFFDES